MRSPTTREGVLMPRFAFVGLLMLLVGIIERDSTAGRWILLARVLSLVTAALVAWRLVYGALLAAGLWLIGLAGLLGWLPARVGAHRYWPLLLGVGLLVLAWPFAAVRQRRTGSRGVVRRWSRRARRNDGVASRVQMLRTVSRFAVRRRAIVLRPSLAQLSWWRRLRTPTRTVATRLARVGLFGVWSPIEDVTLRIGGPRTGKTGELAGRILDAQGAVIATSTRTDLVELTGALRAELGPVGVFNPSGVAGLASTISFDPLSGCRRPKTATDRAADLLAGVATPGQAGGDRDFWAGQARRVLAALLHAAALGGLGMRDVLVWVADPDQASAEVQRLLRRSSEPSYEADALQFLTTNERTRSSICATVMPALGWLTDPTAAAAARAGDFDLARLLAERGTVYMLGAEDAQTAPLVTALTGHIAREARRLSAEQPAGRLDPPLTLALDEAALICPVPLDQWTADMGGRNITIHIAAQSRAQLRQRFGEAGAAAIVNNAATLLIFGGTRDPDDLAAYATLAGERDEDVPTYDHTGAQISTTIRRVPVLSAAQIAQLPAGRVMVVSRGMRVAIGKVQMAWRRRDVRRAARHQQVADQAVVLEPEPAEPIGEVVGVILPADDAAA
jgi:type IV secretion system protein VirD4